MNTQTFLHIPYAILAHYVNQVFLDLKAEVDKLKSGSPGIPMDSEAPWYQDLRRKISRFAHLPPAIAKTAFEEIWPRIRDSHVKIFDEPCTRIDTWQDSIHVVWRLNRNEELRMFGGDQELLSDEPVPDLRKLGEMFKTLLRDLERLPQTPPEGRSEPRPSEPGDPDYIPSDGA